MHAHYFSAQPTITMMVIICLGGQVCNMLTWHTSHPGSSLRSGGYTVNWIMIIMALDLVGSQWHVKETWKELKTLKISNCLSIYFSLLCLYYSPNITVVSSLWMSNILKTLYNVSMLISSTSLWPGALMLFWMIDCLMY